MSSYGSSVINKRKVAPKAPPPRKRHDPITSTISTVRSSAGSPAPSEAVQVSSQASSPHPLPGDAQQPRAPTDASSQLPNPANNTVRDGVQQADASTEPLRKRRRMGEVRRTDAIREALPQVDVNGESGSAPRTPNKRQRTHASSEGSHAVENAPTEPTASVENALGKSGSRTRRRKKAQHETPNTVKEFEAAATTTSSKEGDSRKAQVEDSSIQAADSTEGGRTSALTRRSVEDAQQTASLATRRSARKRQGKQSATTETLATESLGDKENNTSNTPQTVPSSARSHASGRQKENRQAAGKKSAKSALPRNARKKAAAVRRGSGGASADDVDNVDDVDDGDDDIPPDPWKAVSQQQRPKAARSTQSTTSNVSRAGRKRKSTSKAQQSGAQEEQSRSNLTDDQGRARREEWVENRDDYPRASATTSESILRKVKESAKKGRRGRPPARSSAAEDAEDDGSGIDEEEECRGRRTRRRASTESEDENHRIDTKFTAMWDLTQASRKGQVSKLERALRKVDWNAVKRQKEEEKLRALESPNEDGQENEERTDEVTERLERADQQMQQANGGAVGDNAPAMKVVNGQLVFDTSASGANDAQATAEAQAEAAEGASNPDQFEESELANRINTQTWVTANKRDKFERATGRGGGRWNELSTEKFYDAIRIFGADFTMIQKMFPDKTRRQIKLKFVREEKGDPVRMKEVMVGPITSKEPMSIAKFAEMTGKSESFFRDPEILNKELETEREKQQQQLEQERVDLEENVKQKRERARERQKEKEKSRRERNKKTKKKDKDKGEGGTDAENTEGGAGSPLPDTGTEWTVGYDGDEEITQSIET